MGDHLVLGLGGKRSGDQSSLIIENLRSMRGDYWNYTELGGNQVKTNKFLRPFTFPTPPLPPQTINNERSFIK